jgi:phosphohistidine phosphatase
VNIYILRHGIAVERGARRFENDSERPLTSKGKRQLHQSAGAMRKMKLDFGLILSSPFLRARQTAEIVAGGLKLKKRLKFSDELQPDGSVKKLIRQLNELKPAPENILLVGHEPYLSRLIALLATGDMVAAIDLKKGGLCKLETEELEYGHCATLKWLLPPGQMELMV